MVGCLRFLSLSSYPSHTFSLFPLSFTLTDATATVAAAVFCLFFGQSSDPGPDFTSLAHTTSLHLLHPSPSVSARLSVFLTSCPCPCSSSLSSSLRSTSVSISTGSEQHRRGRTRQGHHSTLALPCISPTTAVVRREPGTKWSIYWLNEKIAFFDCKRTLHLMCVMQRPRPVMGSASLLSGETRK